MSGSQETVDHVFTRFKVKLQTSSNERQTPATIRQEAVRLSITGLLRQWQLIDKTVALAPWCATDSAELRTGADASSVVPAHPNAIGPYFYQLYYGQKSDTLWFHMRIRHTISADRLLRSHNQGSLELYIDRVQSAEKPMAGGFFVGSLKEYALSPLLHVAIKDAVRQITRKSIDFTFFWGDINCYPLEIMRGLKAMQVEVDEANYGVVRRALTIIYNGLKMFPLGVKMAYMPPPGRCLDTNLPKQACQRQYQFLRVCRIYEFKQLNHNFSLSTRLNMKSTIVGNPLNIMVPIAEPQGGPNNEAEAKADTDVNNPPNLGLTTPLVGPKTLCELLQAITVNSSPVYHSVLPSIDRGYPAILLVVVPSLGTELARMVHSSPVAFLSQVLDEPTINMIFDEEALMAGEIEAFDTNTQRIVNREETATSDAITSMFKFTFELPSDFDSKFGRQPAKRTKYDTYSFAAGSAQTSPSSSSILKQVRFKEAYANIMGATDPHANTNLKVPGATQATGEQE
jgi:hypothetical protein